MTEMQCTVCRKQDELLNLVAVRSQSSPSSSLNGYAHPRCLDQHNRAVARNLRKLDASMLAGEIFDHDHDATSAYVVEQYLSKRNRKASEQLVADVVAAAEEQRSWKLREAIFSTIEREVESWPAEANEALIGEIAEDLDHLERGHVAEDTRRYAARLLTLQVAWRKHQEATDSAYEEYERSEAHDGGDEDDGSRTAAPLPA